MGKALHSSAPDRPRHTWPWATAYESHSGFRDAFRRTFRPAAGARARAADCIVTAKLESPLGPLSVAATDEVYSVRWNSPAARTDEQTAALERPLRLRRPSPAGTRIWTNSASSWPSISRASSASSACRSSIRVRRSRWRCGGNFWRSPTGDALVRGHRWRGRGAGGVPAVGMTKRPQPAGHRHPVVTGSSTRAARPRRLRRRAVAQSSSCSTWSGAPSGPAG